MVRLWEAKKAKTGLFKAIKAGKKPQKERTTKRATKTSSSVIEKKSFAFFKHLVGYGLAKGETFLIGDPAKGLVPL
jgi:hypothetical protein